MSEYQYYEFRTINRQLAPAQRAEVNRLSSHGHTTATSFSVDYSYGDFKHNPEQVLARYFDLFFYIANWGSLRLMFRYPKDLIDVRAVESYCRDGRLTIGYETTDNNVLIKFELTNEEGDGWIDGEGMVDGVMGLYNEILQRDFRVFYLAWLGAIQDGAGYDEDFDEEMLEPPVPSGLDDLSPSLNEFVEMFGIEEDLVSVATKGSSRRQSSTQIDEAAALAALSKEECVDFLRRFLQGESHLELKLKKRLGLLATDVGDAPTGQRSVRELLAAQQEIQETRRKAAAAAREAQRRAQMAALAAHGESAWQNVERMIELKTNEGYKQAAMLLKQLGELARERGQERIFASRVEEIRHRYNRRSALMRELQRIQP